MLCEPLVSPLPVKVAVPVDKLPDPKSVEPSRKFTVPVGVPEPEVGATIAVKVTELPWIDGLALLVSVVEVPSLLTTFWFSTALWPVVKLLSPL